MHKPPVTTLGSGQSLRVAPRSAVEDDFLVCYITRLFADFMQHIF